ncbi:MAG: aminotransferase class IV [Kofleriaceae bacterium]
MEPPPSRSTPAGDAPHAAAPIVALDGQLCPPEHAVISLFDSGLLHGDGVFTVLRGVGGCPVDLQGHLEQLLADAAQLELRTPSLPELRRDVERVAAAFGPTSARLRVLITRGPGGLHAPWSARPGGRVAVIAEAAGPPRTSARAAIVEEPRLPPSSTWAAKSLSYQAALWARERAARRGAGEALRLFPDDTVGEGAASNLFGVWRGCVVTPPALGVRPGVTRRRVLELCDLLGLPVCQRPIARHELPLAEELFLTSSIAGVVPILAVDEVARPAGPLTTTLRDRYEAEVKLAAHERGGRWSRDAMG